MKWCHCRKQILVLCVHFFVRRGKRPFNLWQRELLSVCPQQRFLQKQSLYTATKDTRTNSITHHSCRSSLVSHAVMVNLTVHTTLLFCLVFGWVFLGGGESRGRQEGAGWRFVHLFKELVSKLRRRGSQQKRATSRFYFWQQAGSLDM